MFPNAPAALEDFHVHQRKIVRMFAPHLSNAALASHERVYLALRIARLVLVLVLPTCAVFYLHDSVLETPVYAVVSVVCGLELVLALYRYFVLWPEGLRMRWNYWHEIEMSADCYKLKILGFYHRRIAKFAGRFPPTMAARQIRSYYRTRSALPLALFTATYIVCIVMLVNSTARIADNDAASSRMWLLYGLSIASALVVLRFSTMHLVELPQVLALRNHPEFAVDLIPPTTTNEAIPFARLVPTYTATADTPAVAIDVEPAIEKHTL